MAPAVPTGQGQGMASYLALLRGNPAYRRLWLGEVVSFLGDWFSTIALYTIVAELSGSALAVAGVLVGKTLPTLLVTPIAGPLCDAVDRRRLMIATDLVRATCVVGLIAAYHAGSLPLIYACLVAMVGCTGVFVPARTASVPQLTSRDEVPVAMALSGASWSVMLALGAAAGGIVTALVGVDGSLVLDGVTYLVSAALLWGLPALPPDAREVGRSGFVDGVRYLRGEPYVGTLVTAKAVSALGAGMLAVLPLYGQGAFPQQGPLWVGLLYGMRGLGALVGSVGVRGVTGDDPATLRRALLPAYLLIALGALLVAAAPTVTLVGFGYLVSAIGTSVIWVFSNTLLQLALDPAYRGRAFSVEFGVMTLVVSALSLLAGALVDAGGATPDGVVVLAALLVTTVGVPYAWRLQRLGSASPSTSVA